MSSEQQQQRPASTEVLDSNPPGPLAGPGPWQIGRRPRRGTPRQGTMRLPGCLALCALLLAGAGSAFAAGNVTVTKATGGSAISADTTGAAYNALTGPTIAESAGGTIGTGTIILHSPAGFIFNTASTVTATVSKVSGPNGTRLTLSSSTATVTTTAITITVTV